MQQENNNDNNLNQEISNENSEINNVSEENNEVVTENIEEQNSEVADVEESPKKPIGVGKILLLILALILIGTAATVLTYHFLGNAGKPEEKPNQQANEPEENGNEENPEEINEENNDDEQYIAYQIKGNSIETFDLQFLKLENNKKNVIYSPLSIKYALEMLKEGANGKSKQQIARIVGDYTPKKYTNNANMSFANALFIKDSYKNSIKSSYVDTLTKSYNAAVVYDSFKTPEKINKWVSEKTFNLINNIVNNVSENDYILANALAIDMEWVNKIQPESEHWMVSYNHEEYYNDVASIDERGFDSNGFEGLDESVVVVDFSATANKYNIVKVLGENNIRTTVGNDYQKWLDDGAENSCYDPEYSDESEKDPDKETYVNQYIKDINENYGHLSSSTDFNFYVDNNIKVFSKDLKKYSGTTLQYVAIMPTKAKLNDYIKDMNASKVNDIINNLKPLALSSFKEGVITEITGNVPLFKFDYKLNLIGDLKELGIVDVFDINKADLSNITTEKSYVKNALHQATIDFSNDGIKASAVTLFGEGGAGDCGYDYLFKPPVEKIDLTFDKPFVFLIIDKNSKEVWFAGSVYEPANYNQYLKDNIKNYDEFYDEYEDT